MRRPFLDRGGGSQKILKGGGSAAGGEGRFRALIFISKDKI